MSAASKPVVLDRNENGHEIQSFKLKNCKGASATIINLGATLTSLSIPSRQHGPINTILGYKSLKAYRKDTMYHGTISGRYCNRIANGQFHLGGNTVQLNQNEGDQHLHGGAEGFHRQLWQPVGRDHQHLHLRLNSPHGEQGYPGNLTVDLHYQLNDNNTLAIRWQAYSDQDTIISLTNHSYFNLARVGDIGNHYLKIHADQYTPVNQQLIPSGNLVDVKNSPFDLQQFRRIKDILESRHPQIQLTGGLDHNWARGQLGELLTSAELYCPETELHLKVSSTQPGLQCYTGNNLDIAGIHRKHEGVCLETQHYPDAPNQPLFPSPVLKAGKTVTHETRFEFKTVSPYEILDNTFSGTHVGSRRN